jgi:hypothetical protein
VATVSFMSWFTLQTFGDLPEFQIALRALLGNQKRKNFLEQIGRDELLLLCANFSDV